MHIVQPFPPQKQKTQHSALYLNRYAFVSDDSWVAPGTGDSGGGGEGCASSAVAEGGSMDDGQGASGEVDVHEPTPLGGRRGEAALWVHNTMILGDHVWFQEVGARRPRVLFVLLSVSARLGRPWDTTTPRARLECVTEARPAPPRGRDLIACFR